MSQEPTIKLFLGCLLSANLRMNLNMSQSWREETIIHQDLQAPQTCFHNKKEYLGIFLDNNLYSYAELLSLSQKLLKSLAHYFPEFSSKNVNFVVFPQIFLS